MWRGLGGKLIRAGILASLRAPLDQSKADSQQEEEAGEFPWVGGLKTGGEKGETRLFSCARGRFSVIATAWRRRSDFVPGAEEEEEGVGDIGSSSKKWFRPENGGGGGKNMVRGSISFYDSSRPLAFCNAHFCIQLPPPPALCMTCQAFIASLLARNDMVLSCCA